MSKERRKSKRVDISVDYYYYPENKRRKIKCILKNISVTGACIISEENINVCKDNILFLHIRSTKGIELKSKAVWKIDNQYGLLFLLDTSRELENISYIMNYEIENINRGLRK